MKTFWRILTFVLAASFSAASANAALVDVTWSGSVSGGNDRTGAFGGVRGQDFNLAGFDYTAVYRFDTDLGAMTIAPTLQQAVGGTWYGGGTTPSPVVSVHVTIHGGTVVIIGDRYGEYLRRSEAAAGAYPGVGVLQTSAIGTSDTPGGVNELFHRVLRNDDLLMLSVALAMPYTRTFGPGDAVTNSNFQRFDAGDLVSANLEPLSVTIAPVPTDGDGDGVMDGVDNCPSFANPGQSDAGGVGVGSSPDGIGDACQCGDVSGDGRVTIADATIMQRSLLLPPTATPAFPDRCDVGGSAGCTLVDAVVIRRALLLPATAVITQQCVPAAP